MHAKGGLWFCTTKKLPPKEGAGLNLRELGQNIFRSFAHPNVVLPQRAAVSLSSGSLSHSKKSTYLLHSDTTHCNRIELLALSSSQ